MRKKNIEEAKGAIKFGVGFNHSLHSGMALFCIIYKDSLAISEGSFILRFSLSVFV